MKQDYKKTSLGIIPNEWEVVKLGDVCEINPKNNDKLPSKFYYIDLESVEKGILLYKNEIYSSKAPSRAKRLLKKGDILFQMVRPYQKNNLYFNLDGDFVASTGYAQIRTLESKKYIYCYLNFDKFTNMVIMKCTGSNYPAINSSVLSNIKIPLPPLKEQIKIAEILSEFDTAINLMSNLISQKTKFKKALMQNLLTAKIRFPNFKDKWQVVRLGEILKERKTYKEKGLNLEHVSLTKDGIIPKSKRYERDFLVKDENKKYKITKLNDICYNPANLKFGVICKNNYGNGIFSPIYVTFECNKNFDIDFISYYVTQNDFIQKVRKFEEGTVYERMAVSPKDFLSFKIKLPNLDEQKKIAEILSSVDDEINLLNLKLKNLKDLKKGVMQNLLTGKVRVK